MIHLIFRKSLAATALTLTATLVHASGIEGDRVNVYFTDSGPTNRTVDFGIRTILGSGTRFTDPFGTFQFDITGEKITLQFLNGFNFSGGPGDFVGLVIADLDRNIPTNYRALAESTIQDFPESRYYRAGNLLAFNFQGYAIQPEKTLVLSAIPEPETFAMLLAGLGLLGTMVRKKTAVPLTARYS